MPGDVSGGSGKQMLLELIDMLQYMQEVEELVIISATVLPT